MANTFDADLVVDVISSQTQTVLGNRLAPIGSFASDFSDEEIRQEKNIRVPFATTASAVQTNPTNFETGDTTLSEIVVDLNHYSKSFHITSQQLNQGFRLEQLVQINAQAFADKLIDVAFTPLTVTNFGTARAITVAQASIADADLQTAFALIAKSETKNLILDGTAYSKFLPTNMESLGTLGRGYNAWYLNTRWNGAGTNVYGFAGGPNALGYASRLPQHGAASDMISQTSIVIPSVGLPVQINVWFSRASRTLWGSMDTMFGVGLGDVTAGALFKSA